VDLAGNKIQMATP
jgi:hypothetical protein